MLDLGYNDHPGRHWRDFVVMVAVIIVGSRNRGSGRSTDTGTDYRAILAAHLSTNGTACSAADCAANRGIFDDIVRPGWRCECTADGDEQCETKIEFHVNEPPF